MWKVFDKLVQLFKWLTGHPILLGVLFIGVLILVMFIWRRKVLRPFEKFTGIFIKVTPYAIVFSILLVFVAIVSGLLCWQLGGDGYLYFSGATSVLSLLLATISIWGQFPSTVHLMRVLEETADVLISWDRYVGRSAELYRQARVIKSIVTEWEIDERLEYSLGENDQIEQAVFIGPVERGHHFFGVVWRLNIIAKARKSSNFQVFCFGPNQPPQMYPKYLIIDKNVVIPRERTEKPEDFIACVYPEKSGVWEVFEADFQRTFKQESLWRTLDAVKKIVEEGCQRTNAGQFEATDPLLFWLMNNETEKAMKEYHKGSIEELKREFGQILRDFLDRYLMKTRNK